MSSVHPAVRVLPCALTVEQLATHLPHPGETLLVDGNQFTFLYHGKANSISLSGGIQLPLDRVPTTDLWTLTVVVPDAARAVLSYVFVVQQQDQPDLQFSTLNVWRGPEAPPPVPRATTLQGHISQHHIFSRALNEQRTLTVYLPPNYSKAVRHAVLYLADGEAVADLAYVVEPAILARTLPDLVLIGVHSSPGPFATYADDLRAQEYLPSHGSPRFTAHAQFFVHEVQTWAHTTFGIAHERDNCAVFGFSNGGVFAAGIGGMFPQHYGSVLAFSIGMVPEYPNIRANVRARFYFVAGTLEEGFHQTTS